MNKYKDIYSYVVDNNIMTFNNVLHITFYIDIVVFTLNFAENLNENGT